MSGGGKRSVAIAVLAIVAAFVAARSGATAPRWHALPRAPIAGRIGEAVTWTGRELIVAGGVTRPGDGTSRRVPDAAAYDPTTRAWRRIASPPLGVGAGAVWTGTELVTWTGNMPDGPAVGAVYTPRSNTWRRLPPGPLGMREGNANVWTGKELLVIGGYSGDAGATPVAAAVDPATGAWRVTRGLAGLTLSGGPNGAVWDGREAIVAGNLSLCPKLGSACEHTRPIVVAYNPATDRMRRLALPSVASNSAASLTPVARSGGAVIFRAWSAGSLRVLGYRPATGRWQIGPTAPCTLSHGTDTQAVWAGDRLVVACAGDGLQVYDPAKASWRRLRPGPSQLNSRAASATTWTGRELIVWSGWAFERFDPTPADGSELLLPR